MDEVRIKHEACSNDAQEKNILNTTVQDIELAISLGIDQYPDDTELGLADLGSLLETVAGDVSSKSGGGGILMQIKEFNTFLERAAMVLEGRA
jgi:hypothetical protein